MAASHIEYPIMIFFLWFFFKLYFMTILVIMTQLNINKHLTNQGKYFSKISIYILYKQGEKFNNLGSQTNVLDMSNPEMLWIRLCTRNQRPIIHTDRRDEGFVLLVGFFFIENLWLRWLCYCISQFYWMKETSNGSWCIGIKGEMSGTVCVTFTWDIYIYQLFIAFVCFVVCSLL